MLVYLRDTKLLFINYKLMKTLKEINVKILEDLFNININNVFIETDIEYKNFLWLPNTEIIKKYQDLVSIVKIKVWVTKTKGGFLNKEATRLKIKRAK